MYGRVVERGLVRTLYGATSEARILGLVHS